MLRISAFADEISTDPNEQLDCLESLNVRYIEFRSILGKNVLDLDESRHAEFRALLDQRGFGLSAIGSPIGKIAITDPFEPHLERYEIALRLAEYYQTPRIRIFSFYMPQGCDPATHRDEVMRRMAELARRAEKRNIVLVLENEKGIYGDSAERVLDCLESVGSPALRHAFDPANYLEVGQPIGPAWAMLRPNVAHFHVKDYCASTGKHAPAGQGDGRIPELLADAVANGYAGFVVLEPHLIVAEKSYGFTGPDRFGEAAVALKRVLDERGLAYS